MANTKKHKVLPRENRNVGRVIRGLIKVSRAGHYNLPPKRIIKIVSSLLKAA